MRNKEQALATKYLQKDAGSDGRNLHNAQALAQLQKKIGIAFRNPALLSEALTHRSFLNEVPKEKRERFAHNERLEFLGDAVLELAVTDKLYRMFPGVPEGKLTDYRSALVNMTSLAETADKLGLNDFLLLSQGEVKGPDRARERILENAFEALVGAIYIDRGFGVATLFLDDVLFVKIDTIIAGRQYLNPKSHFQEIVQEREKVTPHYETLKETGTDHEKVFRIGVFFGERLVAEGDGKSKQEAEQDAARKALEKEYGIVLKNSSL
ncbi:MAG: ribonuclease III [Parcubacteria group bacterium Gr01-1014_48]|nr:MAG: ribonuclease III [Parcubacteria group bacterium Greene0416_14]TSC73723.1 MAG: ribonuclease III [Parcubacteria group bacterium Gr01-1014_48]TSD00994.1 MAG: ribonuclease III [Parcubacteria group bacterium Greene1014_15]TSD08110.1 MAG: ribonuclease III [Parcubacteria group bacterium Greene0714_4]